MPFRQAFYFWERRLAFRDDFERRVLPFEWGSEHLPMLPGFPADGAGSSSRELLHAHSELALARSERYFEASRVSDYELSGSRLRFSSPLPTGVSENDVVHADYYSAEDGEPGRGPAALVLPQWNAKDGAQEGLCRLLNRFGISALKLALPYHERRKPAGFARADLMLSPNVGRTLQSCRQAVIDTRAAVRWLRERGHPRVGIVGTSLGSCIAFITFAHERGLDAGVFNHISPFFADVVWRGISTRQVRQGLEEGLGLDELRKIWLPLSPQAYYRQVKGRNRPTLLIYGRYDLSFPLDLSMVLLRDFEKLGIDHERFQLPCGHYTTGKFPFNWLDGLRIAWFLKRRLAGSGIRSNSSR